MDEALFADPVRDGLLAAEQLSAVAFLARLDAAWAFATERGIGLTSSTVELGLVLHIGERAAQDRVGQAYQLSRRPATRRAVEDGRLGVAQALVVLDELSLLGPADAALIEAELLAGGESVGRRSCALRDWLRRRVTAIDPAAARARRVLSEREATGVHYRSLRDGLAEGVLTGPAIAVQRWMRSLDRLTPPAVPASDRDGGGGDADGRTRGQLMFATAVGAVHEAADRAGIGRPQVALQLHLPVRTGVARVNPSSGLPEPVVIRLDVEGLTASLSPAGRLLARSVPELLGDGPIDPGLVAECLHDDIRVRRVCNDRVTGQAVAVDATPIPLTRLLVEALPVPPGPTCSYQPTADQRRLLQVRDDRCCFPGCTRAAKRCDLDHLSPWPAGDTAVGNLHPLCRFHHGLKHTDWTVTRGPDGTETWTTRGGRTYRRPGGEP